MCLDRAISLLKSETTPTAATADAVVLDKTEVEQTAEEVAAKIQLDMYLYSMEKDPETGFVKIYPMNSEGCITIHGKEEARAFTNHLLDYIR